MQNISYNVILQTVSHSLHSIPPPSFAVLTVHYCRYLIHLYDVPFRFSYVPSNDHTPFGLHLLSLTFLSVMWPLPYLLLPFACPSQIEKSTTLILLLSRTPVRFCAGDKQILCTETENISQFSAYEQSQVILYNVEERFLVFISGWLTCALRTALPYASRATQVCTYPHITSYFRCSRLVCIIPLHT